MMTKSSGSALPAPLALELRRLQNIEALPITLDAIVNVIDVLNFAGFFLFRETASVPLNLQFPLTVLDAKAFPCVRFDLVSARLLCVCAGYEDRSSSARLQAKYTDLILLNKTELASDAQFDRVLDDVCELNPDTPQVNQPPQPQPPQPQPPPLRSHRHRSLIFPVSCESGRSAGLRNVLSTVEFSLSRRGRHRDG